MRRRAAIVLAAAVMGGAAGCGGEDESEPGAAKGVPAAGENTPPAGTPGVPPGASYDLDGRGWRKLSRPEMFSAATDYIADNPEICKGADLGIVTFYVTNSYGADFPLDIPAADVLSEGCAASLQS